MASYGRTRATVDAETLERRPNTNMSLGDNYLSCRYSPFNRQQVKGGIPDGRGRNVIVRDVKLSYSISSKEAIDIRISPMIPYGVMFRPTDSLTVNGTVIGGTWSATAPTADQKGYIGVAFDSILSTLMPSLGATSAEATNYVGARIVTVGYRLFYTGQASLASGLLQADNIPIKVVASQSQSQASTQYAVGVTAPANNLTVPANNSKQIEVDMTPWGTLDKNISPSQVVVRPEQGLHGILHRSGTTADHKFQPWFDSGALTLLSTSGATSTLTDIYATVTAISSSKTFGNFFIDDNFDEVMLRATAGGDFRLEVVYCYEQELSLLSNLMDFAKSSPLMREEILKIDDVLNAGVHPAPFAEPAVAMLSDMMRDMKVSRNRVRRRGRKPPQQGNSQPKPRNPARTARRRRYRQRRAARRRNAK